MGRKPRVEQDGGIYHVIQRGNNRELIFKDGLDKGYFIKHLKNLKIAMDYKVFGFTLLDNHYHLILQTLNHPLRSIMHRINTKYSKYFNQRYERSGHVFGGRYKAISVYEEEYLLSLLRYVHQNPVKANMCHRVEEYHWSSDYFYRTNSNDLVDTDIILGILSPNRTTAINMYKEFMAAEEENIECTISKEDVSQVVVSDSVEENKLKQKSLDEILLATGVSDEEYKAIKSGSRKRSLTKYKLTYAKMALENQYTLQAIGANIRVSETAIRDMLRR